MNPLPDKKTNRSQPPTHIGIVSGLTRLGLLGGVGYAVSKFAKIKPDMTFPQTGMENIGSNLTDLKDAAEAFYNTYKEHPASMQLDLQQIMDFSPYKEVVPSIKDADHLYDFIKNKSDVAGMMRAYSSSFDPDYVSSDLGKMLSASDQVTKGDTFLGFKDLFAKHNLGLSQAEQETIATSFHSIRDDMFPGSDIFIQLRNDTRTKKPRTAAILMSNQSGTSKAYYLDLVDDEGRMYVSDKSSTYFTARKFQYLANEPESITTAQARAYATRGKAEEIRQIMQRAAVYDDMSIAHEDTVSHLVRKGQILHFSLDDRGPVFETRVEDIVASGSPMSKQFPVKSVQESSLINRLLGYGASEKNPRQSLGYGKWVGIRSAEDVFPFLSKVSTSDMMQIDTENYLQARRGFVGRGIWDKISRKRWFGENFKQVEEDEILMTPDFKAVGNQYPHTYKVSEFSKDAELTLRSAYSKYQSDGGEMPFLEWLDSPEPGNYFRANPIDIGENFHFGKDSKLGYIKSREFHPVRERLVGFKGADKSFQVEQIFGMEEGQKFMNNKLTAKFGINKGNLIAGARFGTSLSHYGAEGGDPLVDIVMREIERLLLDSKTSSKNKKNFSRSGLVDKLIKGRKKGVSNILWDFARFQKEMGYASGKDPINSIQVIDNLKRNIVSGDKSAQKMRHLYIDSLIRAQGRAVDDPAFAAQLEQMGHTLTPGGRLVYDSIGRGPVNLVDAYNSMTGLVGENTSYSSHITLSPPNPRERMGFGGRTSVTRPILDNMTFLFGDQSVGIKSELVGNAAGRQDDLLELSTNMLDAEIYGKNTPSISLDEFVANREKYMPDHVGSRGRTVINLPGGQHIAVPTAEYKSGLYTDRTGRDISKLLQSSFDNVIEVAGSGDIKATADTLKEYKGLQMEAWKTLNKDKAVGGVGKYSYMGQVQSNMFSEQDWMELSNSLGHAPFRKDMVEEFGEDFVKMVENPYARQYIVESNAEQLGQLGFKGKFGTAIISKDPNFLGSSSPVGLVDRDALQNFWAKRGRNKNFNWAGHHTVGISKSLRDAPFWDLDQDVVNMQRIGNPENVQALMDQMLDPNSPVHQMRQMGESSFKILNTSGVKEALSREYYDATKGVFSKEFLTSAFQTHKLSFVDIGTIYNKMQVLQATAQEMGIGTGMGLGESSKLIQEMVLKAGGKGAAGVKQAGEFFTQLDLIQSGKKAPTIGRLMDEMMDSSRLTGEAKKRFESVKTALIDPEIQAKIAGVSKRFKSVGSFNSVADIAGIIGDDGMNTLHKVLGPKLAERFPNEARRSILDRATEATMETLAPGRKYLNKKGLAGLAIGALALRSILGSSGHKVPDIEPENNPIGQNPSFSQPGQGSRIPKLVMGNGNQSMDIRSKIKRGHLGQFLANIQGSFHNVRINDNSKDVTPEDIQDMVMENRYNSWRHDRSRNE